MAPSDILPFSSSDEHTNITTAPDITTLSNLNRDSAIALAPCSSSSSSSLSPGSPPPVSARTKPLSPTQKRIAAP
ncbi:hypothetical protein DPSP01_008979 [Paraphaeosphaeria sporulosa]